MHNNNPGSADSETSGKVYFDLETAHALANNLKILDDSVRILLTDGESGEWARVERSGKNTSLRQFVEQKISNSEVSLDVASRIIGVFLRETEYFRVLVLNLIGAYTAQSKLPLHFTLIRIGDLVREILELFAASAAAKGVRVEDRQIDGNLYIRADRDLIHRAIVNLISNTVKYSAISSDRANRFIKVECKRHSIHGDCLVVVSSYGEVDIRDEEVASGEIFRYGSRGKTAKEMRIPGSGVGLAEAKRIMDAHGGELTIRSVDVGQQSKGEVFVTTAKMVIPHGSR